MPNWEALEKGFTEKLQLKRPPVAVTFLDSPSPAGVEPFKGSAPASCSFWKLAADGRVFSTVAADHYNCPIGAHTQNLPLPEARAKETEKTLGMMFELGYIRPEEVGGIPTLAKTPVSIVYAPLGRTPVAPSVVLFICPASSAMLLNEAATRAGSGGSLPVLGRPTCMALPAALAKGTVASLGCIGNRVYTGIRDDEFYFVVPATDLERVAEALGVIAGANAALAEYARGKLVQLTAN
jgi:uncharacterized protein (DUF169 family)